jgi:hypothetical protein
MGDKIIKESGGKGAAKTENHRPRTWCGSERMGKSCACSLGCLITKGKSIKKAKQTRDKYASWTTKRMLVDASNDMC